MSFVKKLFTPGSAETQKTTSTTSNPLSPETTDLGKMVADYYKQYAGAAPTSGWNAINANPMQRSAPGLYAGAAGSAKDLGGKVGGYASDVLGGKYLDPATNQFLTSNLDVLNNEEQRTFSNYDKAIGSRRTGSGAYQLDNASKTASDAPDIFGISSAYADAKSKLLGGAYQTERGFQQGAAPIATSAQGLYNQTPELTQAGGDYSYGLDIADRNEALGAEGSQANQLLAIAQALSGGAGAVGNAGRAAGGTSESSTVQPTESPFETAFRVATGAAGAAMPFFMPGMPGGSALPKTGTYNPAYLGGQLPQYLPQYGAALS